MTALVVINQAGDKSYKNALNVSPFPAAFCETYLPATSPVFTLPSRWLMISDAAAKVVQVRLAGVTIEPNTIAGVGGDITMAANGVLTSSTGGKFGSLGLGQLVKLSGFANYENNNLFVVGPSSTDTQLNLKVPGTIVISGSTLSGGTAPVTFAETPAGTAAQVAGPSLSTQETITFTAQPGVMYPISADQLIVTNTTATSVFCLR